MSAARRSRARGDALGAFDELPAPIRAALHDALIDWDPRPFRSMMKQLLKAGVSEADALAFGVAEIKNADMHELLSFARRWPTRLGRYPHLAAEATIARSDSARRRRRR